MACRSAGRVAGIAFSILAVVNLSCIYLGREKPLVPRLVFTTGSTFLADVTALAVKGRIQFEDGKSSQSGGFQLFLSGDSLSLLVEGPLNVDVLKLLVFDKTVFVRSRGQEWKGFNPGESVSIPEYGIENISPSNAGLFIFPQYYFRFSEEHLASGEIASGELEYDWDNQSFSCEQGGSDREFLMKKDSDIIALYSGRKDLAKGYYPSIIRIFDTEKRWQISVHIDALRLDPAIPPRVWIID